MKKNSHKFVALFFFALFIILYYSCFSEEEKEEAYNIQLSRVYIVFLTIDSIIDNCVILKEVDTTNQANFFLWIYFDGKPFHIDSVPPSIEYRKWKGCSLNEITSFNISIGKDDSVIIAPFLLKPDTNFRYRIKLKEPKLSVNPPFYMECFSFPKTYFKNIQEFVEKHNNVNFTGIQYIAEEGIIFRCSKELIEKGKNILKTNINFSNVYSLKSEKEIYYLPITATP